MSDTGTFETLSSISRLTQDLKLAARTLSDHEAKFLVDAYYAMQRDRIRATHQERTLSVAEEPHDVMSWLAEQRGSLEDQVRRALDAYSGAHLTGVWARSIMGIGPVIAAGLLANIDITRAPTVGHIWRFAGLDPTIKWETGKQRPWNASLKRLCFLIGESFVKVSNNERDVYGKVYKARKELEARKNEAGDYADQAKASLAAKKFGADTEARKHYEAGRLPPGRLHLRAERYATKLFLSGFHEVSYFARFARLPPKPYAIEHLGHAHYFEVPNVHLVPGLKEAKDGLVEQPTSETASNKVSEPSLARAPRLTSEPTTSRTQDIAIEPSKKRAPRKVSSRGR